MTIVNLNIENPDSASIASKSNIDIGVYRSDISSSMYSQSIKLNYSANSLIVEVPENDKPIPPSGKYVYYTPVYSEKISYAEWKTVIDKTFRELT